MKFSFQLTSLCLFSNAHVFASTNHLPLQQVLESLTSELEIDPINADARKQEKNALRSRTLGRCHTSQAQNAQEHVPLITLPGDVALGASFFLIRCLKTSCATQ